MPPLPVIANTYRVTVPWIGSVPPQPRNIFHVRSASTDVLAIGAAIGRALQTARAVSEPWKLLSSDYQTNILQILPLDGSTATVDCPVATTWQGISVGEKMPQVCNVVNFKTGKRGARGRGRIYIGPMTEAHQNDGVIPTGDQVEVADGWSRFRNALIAETPSSHLVVASYVHADANDVVSVRCDAITGTQRRRVNQLR